MATETPLFSTTLSAAADLSAKQFYFVKVDGNGDVALCSAAGEASFGILTNTPKSGYAASVMVAGLGKVVAGGTINEGDLITTDANAKAVAATKAHTNTSDAGVADDPLIGSYVIGIALSAAAAGELVEILITHAGAVAETAA